MMQLELTPYKTSQRRDRDRPHAATFPLRLPEHCLRSHGLLRIEMVMDPFLGLGSTAVACARLAIPFIGVEIDESYLSEAVAGTKADITGRMVTPELLSALPCRQVISR
jgi:site-specific DNA-methyltransferase (adenine-specific)